MRVVALVPLPVVEIVDFADVVSPVEGAAMVCDAVELVMRGLVFAFVVCKKAKQTRPLNKSDLLEWGEKAVMSSVSGKFTVVLSFSRRMAEW